MSTLKAVALIIGDSGLKGSVQFLQEPNGATHVSGRISGLSPGLHGFHIHALGDTTNGCNSTGVAEISISDRQIPLSGPHSILGRAVVVHADPDDLGKDKMTSMNLTSKTQRIFDCGLLSQRRIPCQAQ